MVAVQSDLAPIEGVVMFRSLEEAEVPIRAFLASFKPAAQAILDVYENELWREANFESFDEWWLERSSGNMSRASQLMSAGRFLRHAAVHEPDLPMPDVERHFRPLTKIKRRRSSEPPFGFIENEEEVQERRVVCWRMVLDNAKAQGLPVTGDFVSEIVDVYFKGGAKQPRAASEKQYSVADLEDAFSLIVSVFEQVPPEEAVEKWGSPDEWEYYGAAKRFLDEL